MSRIAVPIIVAGLIASSVAALWADDSKADLAKLEGQWKTESFLLNGGPLPEEKQYPDRLMTIKGGTFSELRNGKVAVRGTIKIGSSKTPKWLDATFEEGGPAPETIQGIYELNGDTLKVCIGTPDTPRPTVFESKPKTGLRLIVYKRHMP